MRADRNKLVHDGKSPEDGMIIHMNVARDLSIVGENGGLSNVTIMSEVHVGHYPIVVADMGDRRVLRRPAIECAKFADRVTVAYDQAGGFARILLVLRRATKRIE